MVEQNATLALSIADRGYVIQNGRIVLADTAERLSETHRCALRTSVSDRGFNERRSVS